MTMEKKPGGRQPDDTEDPPEGAAVVSGDTRRPRSAVVSGDTRRGVSGDTR